MKRDELIKRLETFAPLELQEDWDNSGWQIRTETDDIKKIMFCVSATQNVIEQAVSADVELLISHHPVIFPTINSINDPKIIQAIKNDLQIYSLHTNFDKAQEGTSAYLAQILGFCDLKKFNDFVQVTELCSPIKLDELILKTKLILNLEKMRIFNYIQNAEIKKIAFCAGSGGSFVTELDGYVDLFITSDIKFHDIENLSKCAVFDVGHLESERPSLKKLAEIISDCGVEVSFANEKTNVVYV